jgi:group I intron endonuclease
MPSITHISCIYRIYCAPSDKSYVGSTEDSHKRFGAHRRMLITGKHHSISLQRAWDKYGEDAFTFEVLEDVTPDQLLEREKVWFALLNADNPNLSYNVAPEPGAPMKDRQHSEATKRLFSQSRQGQDNANYRGRIAVCPTCGDEFKPIGNRVKYCSHACYAKAPKSPETLEKYSNASKGKKQSPLSKELYFQKRAQWFVITDPKGIEYTVQGLARFCREHDLDQGSMSHVMRGRYKNYKGWLCRPL